MGSKQTSSFLDALTEEVAISAAKRRPPCEVCKSQDKDHIEAAIGEGTPFSVVARSMQRAGQMEASISKGTASDRVAAHARTHMNGS